MSNPSGLLLFSIIILNLLNLNDVSSKPPMGWISGERFGCQINCKDYPRDCISSNLINRTANTMVNNEWSKFGYEYIILDDCWQHDYRDDVSGDLILDRKRFNKVN